MREILFKAKSIQTGEWIEGIPIKTHLGLFISFEENPHYCSQYGYMEIDDILIVDEKTLCQFTGLCDKNGKRIWENDVVWLVYNGEEHIYQIVWDNSELDFKATNGEENYGSNFEYLLCCDESEVIGNIFDNRELLQEE